MLPTFSQKQFDALMSNPNLPKDIRQNLQELYAAEGISSPAIQKALKHLRKAAIKKMVKDETLDKGL